MEISMKSYRKVLDNLFDAICIVDEDGKVSYWNAAAEEMSGYESSEIVGRRCEDIASMYIDKNGDSLAKTFCPSSSSQKSDEVQIIEKAFFHHKEGYRVPVAVRILPITYKGSIVGAVQIIRDLSSNITLEQIMRQLEQLAMYDPITELPNRKYIEQNIIARLAELQRYGWVFGTLFISIDEFGNMKEKFGKDILNKILRVVAMTMRNTLRPFDVVGRWRDEYFVVVVSNVAEEQLQIVAERLRRLVENSTITIGDSEIRTTISVGGTIASERDKIDFVLRKASEQMLQAKEMGGNIVSIASRPEFWEEYQIP